MSRRKVEETIDRWIALANEYANGKNQRAAEQVKNWLFGASTILLDLGDETLLGISGKAFEASLYERMRNRTVGAGPGDNLGISGVDSQREDMARATRCPRTAGADGGA